MRILVTGVNGLLGKDIARAIQKRGCGEVVGVGRGKCLNSEISYYQLDLLDTEKLEKLLQDVNPDIIIHCAAYTKLDDCERNREYAYRMNVGVTKFLAEHAKRLVYMSSDAVFSGEKGNYKEADVSDAINYYGCTKYEGEEVARLCANCLIIRSSIYGYNLNDNKSIAEWGLDNFRCGKSINGFSDVVFNPLYSVQLANILLDLLERGCTDVFHLGAKQTISKYDFFKLLAKSTGVSESLVRPISVDALDFAARRTKNTSLCIDKACSIIEMDNDIYSGVKQMLCDMDTDRKW